MADPRLDKLANLLVRYSTCVQPGDVVALVGPPLAEPLLLAAYREVLLAGGHPVVHMEPEADAELLLKHGNQEQLSLPNPFEAWLIENCAVSIYFLAPVNTRALTQIDPGRQVLLETGRRRLMDTFLRRAAKGDLRWAVAQMPCLASAQEADLSLSEYEDFVYQACLLDVPDPIGAWYALGERQQRVIDFLQGVTELRFRTPAGTDLKVSVAGRTWMNSDGRENLPDGEVFTGPWEDVTEGVVHFTCPTLHKGREIAGIRLVFREGRVVEASAARGEEYLLGLLDQDPGARILGEVALGCNYAIARPTRNALFDEKIGGTFHVALGASYPATGGRNTSSLHWDLICDLREGGVIEADGAVISRNGRFVEAAWPQPPGG
ncbi:MAG TPA: aminopeptidase [Gemmataceae bacterium]|jgi:aminopeptidase|nr:aminopeptidase [Gemmataceae bacterium]